METEIIRALNGDREAFSWLYDRFAPSALRVATAITRSADLAQDAVQAAFLRVFRKGRCEGSAGNRHDNRHSNGTARCGSWFYRCCPRSMV